MKLEINRTTPYVNEVTYASDGIYMYGGMGTAIKKITSNGTISTGHDFGAGYTVNLIWTTPTVGKIFVLVNTTATSMYSLYLSNDSGDTLANSGNPVLLLGDDNGSQVSSVSALHQGFATAEIGGVQTYFIGEYNFNPARTPGGANDSVRLLSSTDGITWSTVATWNTDGTTYITHIHAVVADPAGGIFVCFGDTTPGSGILRWDGAGAWIDNVLPSAHIGTTGFLGLCGSQSYRTVGLIISDNYVHWFSDTPSQTTATSGIWRAGRDLANPEKVNTDIQQWPDHYGWEGIITETGTLVITEEIDSVVTTVNRQIHIWTSVDEGATWTPVSLYNTDTGTVAYVNVFEHEGNIVFSDKGTGAGKAGATTVLTQEAGPFSEEFPIIIHPVFFVSSTGDNTNGYTPAKAFTSPVSAYSSGVVPHRGIRLIMGAEAYVVSGLFQIVASALGTAGTGTGIIVLEGAGKNKTMVTIATGNLCQVATAGIEVLFKDFQIYTQGIGYTQYVKPGSVLHTRDMIFGNLSYAHAQVSMWIDGTLESQRTTFLKDQLAINIAPQAASASVSLKNCIVYGGTDACWNNFATETWNIENCTILNYKTSGYTFGASATAPENVVIKNNIFYSVIAGAKDLIDLASLTEDDAHIDYNRYSNGLTNIANSGGSHSTTGDPLFADYSGGNYNLQASSPCINTGYGSGITNDFELKPVVGVMDIGAFQWLPQSSFARSPITTPGPLNISATITAGTTYPDITIKAPIGPEFQAITEWTGGAAVDLSTFAGSNYTRVGPRGMMIYGSERTADEIAAIDRYLGVV